MANYRYSIRSTAAQHAAVCAALYVCRADLSAAGLERSCGLMVRLVLRLSMLLLLRLYV
jgi:hypothetical protein